jgi:DNA (cytosine-5)-methyltransferase 1
MNMPKKRTTPTYVSLFSGGGVGCHAFTAEGFECIVTNETIKQRLDIQRYNNKCRHDSGYVLGDITADEVKTKVFDEIDFWKKNEGLKDVDILIATDIP